MADAARIWVPPTASDWASEPRASRHDGPDAQFERAYEGARAIRLARTRTAAFVGQASAQLGPRTFADLVAYAVPGDEAGLARFAECVPIPAATLAALRDHDLAPGDLAPGTLVDLGRACGLSWDHFHALVVPSLAFATLQEPVAGLSALWQAAEDADGPSDGA